MKINILTTLLLLVSNIIFSQHKTIRDTIIVSNKKYDYTHISYGTNSRSKPTKIIICEEKNIQKTIEKIQKCFVKSKMEYTEFYFIPINKNEVTRELVIYHFLNRIDQSRISNNLYTIQISCKEYFDNSKKNIHYTYEKSILKKIDEIEDLHQYLNPNNICNTISGIN